MYIYIHIYIYIYIFIYVKAHHFRLAAFQEGRPLTWDLERRVFLEKRFEHYLNIFFGSKAGPALPTNGLAVLRAVHDVNTLRVEYAERGKYYGILFIFSLFCEYSNLEYVHINVIYRVNQAECVI